MITPEDVKKGPCRLNRRYEAMEHLGQGSFGAVYKGRSLFMPYRNVAIKYLYGESLLDGPSREAVFAEAEKFQHFEHPNIVRLWEVAKDRDRDWFMVSQFVDGNDLSELLRDRRARRKWIDTEPALRIIHDLLNALHYIHEHDIIHRDIKPDNILVDQKGKAMLADFGIAVRANRQKNLFEGGTGTPMFMHPLAKKGDESIQNDLFSLGIVAYILLSGVHPFADPALVFWPPWKLLDNELWTPDPVSLKNPMIPKAIGDVVDRMLHKDRLAQFQNAADTLTAFRQAQAYRQCSECKQESPPSARFCFSCGTQLVPDESPAS